MTNDGTMELTYLFLSDYQGSHKGYMSTSVINIYTVSEGFRKEIFKNNVQSIYISRYG